MSYKQLLRGVNICGRFIKEYLWTGPAAHLAKTVCTLFSTLGYLCFKSATLFKEKYENIQ